MRFHHKLLTALFFSMIVLFLSLFMNIIPCQTAPSVPNPEYMWKFCTLNPDVISSEGISRIYFGYSSSLRDTFIFTFLTFFLLVLILLAFFGRKRKGDN